MKKIKELNYLDNNNKLSKFFGKKNPMDQEILRQVKAGELSVAVVDLETWQCVFCGATNDKKESYCWFCEHAK